MIRRLGVGVTFVLVLSLAAAATSSAHSRHKAPKCPPAHSHVLKADAKAVVYELGGEGEELACSYRHRRSYTVQQGYEGSTESGNPEVSKLVLVDSVLAYEEDDFGRDHMGNLTGGRQWVTVRDLSTGRILHRVPTGPGPPDGTKSVTTLVAKSDGAIAWITETKAGNYVEPTEIQVRAADRNGSRLLASGLGISGRLLTLAGSTIHWIQDGKPASATLM